MRPDAPDRHRRLKAEYDEGRRLSKPGEKFMTFAPSQLAFKYCAGKGAELGASRHNAFGLADCPNIAPSDGARFLHPRDLEDYRHYVEEQGRCGHEAARVDEIGDFRNIPFASGTLDYLVSSHVIEHEPNPVAAFVESFRVLKEAGIFFCIFPKRDAEKNRDVFRPLSTLEAQIKAYETDLTALSSEDAWRGHYYVYSLQSMMRLVNWINRQGLTRFCVEAVEETDSKVGNGHTLVLRKLSPHGMKDADYSLLIESCITHAQYDEALLAAKISLSFDFFNPALLHAAAILSLRADAVLEAREFYRQSLIQQPENEYRRREFHEIFGEFYRNPLP
jgi:SAM-dependent methyltransferase